jgi:aminoglycoside 6'-N-acetyltransferase I
MGGANELVYAGSDEMTVRLVEKRDGADWLRMRLALWPDCSAEHHAQELADYLSLAHSDGVVLVAERQDGKLCGFLETSIRSAAEGCWNGPIGYIEGLYVDPDMRRQGVGRSLVDAAERWAVSVGCCEMGSDAKLANQTSIDAHKSLGYGVVNRLVHFRKPLSLEAAS